MASIRQILPVTGEWYRVVGTRKSPRMERVVLWALCDIDGSDVIVGVPNKGIGAPGVMETLVTGVAGHLELSENQLEWITDHPDELDNYHLVWGDE